MDDKSKTGADRKRISLSEDYEVRDWMASFGVTKEELIEAVHKVGDSSDRVREYLQGRRK